MSPKYAEKTAFQFPSPEDSAVSRTLRVSELLDNILLAAGPSTQFTALSVSSQWRCISVEIMGGKRNSWNALSVDAVQYGALMNHAYYQDDLASEELEQFRQSIYTALKRGLRGRVSKMTYLPGRLTQRNDLCFELSVQSRILETYEWDLVKQPWELNAPGTQPLHTYWFDFSQLHINPYFASLFGPSLRMPRGRIEIALPPSLNYDNLFPSCTTMQDTLFGLIGEMSITQPPCKTVGVYCYDRSQAKNNRNAALHFLGGLHNKKGMSISKLMNTLLTFTARLYSSWTEQAKKLQQEVSISHWIDDIWELPGRPTFILLLGHADARYGKETIVDGRFHRSRHAYMSAWNAREEREGKWVPRELMEPAKTETCRSNINWDH